MISTKTGFGSDADIIDKKLTDHICFVVIRAKCLEASITFSYMLYSGFRKRSAPVCIVMLTLLGLRAVKLFDAKLNNSGVLSRLK